jgi:hypothetical protein
MTEQEMKDFFDEIEKYRLTLPWYDQVVKICEEYERIMEAYRPKPIVVTTDHTTADK